MGGNNVHFVHEQTSTEIERLKVLRNRWEMEKCKIPETAEGCGPAADALKEIARQYVFLEQAVSGLLEGTIETLTEIDFTFVETDEKLAGEMGGVGK